MVQGEDEHGAFFELVASGQDHVAEGGAARLVGGVVAALHFFDEFVQLGQFVDLVGSNVAGVGDSVVDELLEESGLGAGVGGEAEDAP